MTVFSDEGLCKQIEEYSNTLADIPDFLDQVKERIELLREQRGAAEGYVTGANEEVERIDTEHRAYVRALLEEVSHDQAILIDWALDAGADPGTVGDLKSAMTAEAIWARAQARQAF